MLSRTPLSLLVLATFVVASACGQNGSKKLLQLDTCTSKRVNHAAKAAFFGFAKEVAPCWQRLLEVSTYEHNLEITSEGLRALIPDGTKPQCLGELVIVNGRISVGRLLSNHEVCNATVWRMHVIRIALTHLWAGSDVFKPMSMPIRFWFDYTAGSVLTPAMYEYLRYPVLTPGRSPKDTCSFPVPHVYYFYAIVGANSTLLEELQRTAPDVSFALNRREVWHAEEMATVLRKKYTAKAWEDQVPKAVYRGSCYPTANPDALSGDKYLFLRGGLCEVISKANLNHKTFDIGTLIDPEYVQDELSPYCSGTFYGKLCKQCAPCNGTVQSMTREQQSEYKYQVSIEGYGPTADAIYWKLKSNSVVMHVVRDMHNFEPYYTTWFSGLLKPFVHYMPVSMEYLPTAVSHCLKNDRECRKIAAKGLSLALCELSIEAQTRYMGHVLHLVQEMQLSLLDSAVLAVAQPTISST